MPGSGPEPDINASRLAFQGRADPGAPGQVYGGTQVGNLCRGQVVSHVISLADVPHDGRRHCPVAGVAARAEQSCSTYSSARVKQTTKATGQP